MLKNYFNEEEYLFYKENDNIIYKSLELANRVFEDKNDKGGLPYIIHLLRVYSGVSCEIEKAAALLHDIIEDTDITYQELEEFNINKEIINILKILTKLKGEDYAKYIDRIIKSNNIHALNIKLADLSHNMEVGRIKNPTINDYERINKRYLPAREKILRYIQEMEK